MRYNSVFWHYLTSREFLGIAWFNKKYNLMVKHYLSNISKLVIVQRALCLRHETVGKNWDFIYYKYVLYRGETLTGFIFLFKYFQDSMFPMEASSN